MSVNYDYQVKLIGILPQGYAFGPQPQRFHTHDLKIIRAPSDQIGITGILEREGHPNLEGTAIIEKMSHMKPKPTRPRRNYSNCENGLPSHEEESDEESSQTDSNWVTDESENSGSGTDDESDDTGSDSTKSVLEPSICSSGNRSIAANFRLTVLNDWNRGSLRMRWLKNNFTSEIDELPQITCNRRFLTQFMTRRERFYTVKAKKTSFFSRGDTNQGRYIVIELSGGYSFHNLKDPFEEKKEKREFFQPPESQYPEDKSTAFFLAVLSRIGSGGVSSHKIKILLDSSIDGVWKKREPPEDYDCEDMAEVRHVEASTIYPPPWRGFLHNYKQSVLADHWAQSRLIGANKYITNVYGDKNDSDLIVDKKLKEMWLYDVESVPAMVRQTARTDGFRAWNKKDMFGQLYSSLQYIRNYMAGSGMSEDETIFFVHYENENHLLPLNSEDMDDELNCLREAKKTIIIKNITFDSPDLLVAEENAKSLVESLMSQQSGTDRWPKPQLLMFPEQKMFHLKFKYLQHATTFMRIAKKFVRTNASPALRAVRISRQITERLQNLLSRTAGYDDGGGDDHQTQMRMRPRVNESSSQNIWGFHHRNSVPANNSGAFVFPNATTDQNWRIALNLPHVGK